MHLCYLSSSDIPSRAANGIHVMRMCQAFARLGHRVELVAKQGGAAAVDDYSYYGVIPSFAVVKCRRPPLRRLAGDWMYAWEAARLLRQRPRPDLFYARHIYSLAAVARSRVPMVFEAHTPPVHCLQRWVEGWVYRQRHFRGLVVISEALRREYSRLYPGLGGDRVVVAHDATDPVESRGGCEHRDAWPGRAGHLQVGYVGHLYNGRGIDLMLTLAAVLTTMDFHLVGGMEKDIDRWRRSCRSANVHFHGFRLPRDIHRYFERFDVLLAPYQARVFSVGGRKEITRWMSPLKIFDYMMAGKAMVCTDLPVLREILTDRVNALLVPAGDVAAWTRAISSLAEDARLRAALGQRARRQVLAHHTWQQRAASLCAFLQIPAGVP